MKIISLILHRNISATITTISMQFSCDSLYGSRHNPGLSLCCPLSLHAGGSDVTIYDGIDVELLILVVGTGTFTSIAWSIGSLLMIFFSF